jgi:hypothetical protein
LKFTQFYDPGLLPITGFGRYFAASIYVVGAATLFFALLMLVRPLINRQPATEEERERARRIVEAHGCSSLARLTLLEDKSYFFCSRGSVVAYAEKGRIAVALGDPIGPAEDVSSVIGELSSRPKKLRERIGERLAAKDQLYQEDNRFFWGLSSAEAPARMLPSKFDLKNHLRASILSDGESDPHRLALLNVASASGLLNLIFTQDELPVAQHRIHEKVVRTALENPAMQTIEEIEQAILTSLEDDLD